MPREVGELAQRVQGGGRRGRRHLRARPAAQHVQGLQDLTVRSLAAAWLPAAAARPTGRLRAHGRARDGQARGRRAPRRLRCSCHVYRGRRACCWPPASLSRAWTAPNPIVSQRPCQCMRSWTRPRAPLLSFPLLSFPSPLSLHNLQRSRMTTATSSSRTRRAPWSGPSPRRTTSSSGCPRREVARACQSRRCHPRRRS